MNSYLSSKRGCYIIFHVIISKHVQMVGIFQQVLFTESFLLVCPSRYFSVFSISPIIFVSFLKKSFHIGYTFNAHKILILPMIYGSLIACSIARLVDKDRCPVLELVTSSKPFFINDFMVSLYFMRTNCF